MRYFIIAGEPSGDAHAARLMAEIKKLDSVAQFRFFGGDQMARIGGEPLLPLRELSFMGFTQLLPYLGKIIRNFRLARRSIAAFRPNRLILVDYPGFNLRVARWASRKDFRVVYYISPKLWAWRQGRVRWIRKYVDQLLVILPFETDFYKGHGVEAIFVGNPVLEDVLSYKKLSPPDVRKSLDLPDGLLIALLPGSRNQEVRAALPVFVKLTDRYPDAHFVVAGHPDVDEEYYKILDRKGNISLRKNKTHEILVAADAALVTSGTATLETALHGVPQVVCYKTAPLSYQIAKGVIKVKWISLVNLVVQKEAVRELIQKRFTVSLLQQELDRILPGAEGRKIQLADYQKLAEKLGEAGASANAARLICEPQE